MIENLIERMKERKTLAYRLKQGDKLWIGGHFVQLVKVPISDRESICGLCGFDRKCPRPVMEICVRLAPDDVYLYGIGQVEQQNVKQQIVEPK